MLSSNAPYKETIAKGHLDSLKLSKFVLSWNAPYKETTAKGHLDSQKVSKFVLSWNAPYTEPLLLRDIWIP